MQSFVLTILCVIICILILNYYIIILKYPSYKKVNILTYILYTVSIYVIITNIYMYVYTMILLFGYLGLLWQYIKK
jgi:hypothetical protein